MKLSKNDLRILMAIKKADHPLANYEIAKSLELHPAQTHKRLAILQRERILHAIEGYPKFYTFNGRNVVQDFIVMIVECPKCQRHHIVHHSQVTIQCDCITKSGKFTRFYVFPHRVKHMSILSKNQDKTPEPA